MSEALKRSNERRAMRAMALAKSPTQKREAAALIRATLPAGFEEDYRAKEERAALRAKMAAVGKSKDSPVRRSIFASPVKKMENEQQKYNRERYEAFQKHGAKLKDIADRNYRRWAKEAGDEDDMPDFDAMALEELGPFVFKNPPPGVRARKYGESSHYGDVEKEMDEFEGSGYYGGMLSAKAPAYIPRPAPPPPRNQFLGPNSKPFGERPSMDSNLVYPAEAFHPSSNPYLPPSVASSIANVLGSAYPRFHTREYSGRGRLGFMNDLPGSSRPW